MSAPVAATGPETIVPVRRPFWERFDDGMMALSLANLCFISAWFPPLYDPSFAYFSKIRVARMTVLALGTNLLALALLIWLALVVLRRLNNKWLDLAGHYLFLCLLLLPVNFIRGTLLGITYLRLLEYLRHPVVLAGGLGCAGLLIWQHRRVSRLIAIALGVLSPFAIFILVKLALLGFNVGVMADPTKQGLLQSPVAVAPDMPRVVWIIFDESDYRLMFDDRPAWLQLPEFDRLRRESVWAANALPPGGRTLVSMPALISGQRISVGPIRDPSDLRLTLTRSGQVTNWSGLGSVFSSAQELGANTALVGWYHPYSRVLRHGINYCSWFPFPTFGTAYPQGYGITMRRQIASLFKGPDIRSLFVDVCRASLAEAVSVITNRDFGLTLLHLPPPHPPGIYLPEKHQLTSQPMPVATGYLNNLALADQCLGTLRRALDEAGLTERTWLIVSSDHSWRDSRIYDGRWSPRVPFFIKSPHESQSITYPETFDTVLTHDLILAILRKEIDGSASAVSWLDAHKSATDTSAPARPAPGD